jgi:hypothetical protein
MELTYRRPDGTFVAAINGYPYHVTADDQRFAEAKKIADGLGKALPFEPLLPKPEPTPITIHMWQARAALDIKGLLDAADAAVAASTSPAIRQYWQYATTLDEGNDFTKAFAATIGLTDKQMHDLFVAASEIKLNAG